MLGLVGTQKSVVIEINECSLDVAVILARLPNVEAIVAPLLASCWCGGEQELVIALSLHKHHRAFDIHFRNIHSH
jgi:hypothetical protein